MENWRSCLINVEKRIVDAVKIIDSTGAKIALVVDEKSVLVGTVTDYDVRQAVLKGHCLEQPVTTVMNASPKFARCIQADSEVFLKMKNTNVRQMPLVDENHKVTGLRLLGEFDCREGRKTNPVLIMAGGLGSRLRPLTDNCPKSLLKIGSKPILEIILENFIKAGFTNFYFSVNYKAEMIKTYFGEGGRYGVHIHYLQEEKMLGTAGALGLLPKGITEPLIVMNGDLLTKVNFHQLLDFHNNHQAKSTMCVREYKYQIPYGVIKFENWEIKEVQEKPSYSSFVNAGIYVINPEIFYRVKCDQFFDMTELFKCNIKNKEKTLVFPIREYWLDVGRLEDFERAQEEFIV